MISLSRHIELLLLEHNCVIVPGLGGFIANIASASYNDGPDGDKLFIPPYRTIGFNPMLQVNDGLLVQSYMQAFDASYPAAQLQMEKDIEQLNMQLNLCGEYHLDGIGTLRKSLEQGTVLVSSEAGILTPSLYGTYSFEIKSLEEVLRDRIAKNAAESANIIPIQTESDLKEEKQKRKEETPVLFKLPDDRNKSHKYWYDFAIAAVASVIIFIAFLIPNIKTMNGEQETYIAGTLPSNNPRHTVDTRSNTVANASKASDATVKKHEDKAETKNEKKEAEAINTQTDTKAQDVKVEKNYTIVLASFVNEKNSNILIENLASQGFKEGQFIKKGKTTRVIYSAFATEQEASNALLELRKQNEAFAEAWTLKLN